MEKTTIHYRIAINRDSGYTSWLAADGYSKYHQRLTLYNEKKINGDEIYGIEQAKDHINEYYSKTDEHTSKRQEDKLSIEKVTTIVEVVAEITFHPMLTCQHKAIMYINSTIGWLCLDCKKFSLDKISWP